MIVFIFLFFGLVHLVSAKGEAIGGFPELITACGTSGPQKMVSLKNPETGEKTKHNCIEAMVYGCSLFCTSQNCKGNTTLQGSCLSYCPDAKKTCLSGELSQNGSLSDDLKVASSSGLTKDIMEDRNEKEEASLEGELGADLKAATRKNRGEPDEAEEKGQAKDEGEEGSSKDDNEAPNDEEKQDTPSDEAGSKEENNQNEQKEAAAEETSNDEEEKFPNSENEPLKEASSEDAKKEDGGETTQDEKNKEEEPHQHKKKMKDDTYWKNLSKTHQETLVDTEHDTSENHPPQEEEKQEAPSKEPQSEEDVPEDEGAAPMDDAEDLKDDAEEHKNVPSQEEKESDTGEEEPQDHEGENASTGDNPEDAQ